MSIQVNRGGLSIGQFSGKEILEGYRSGEFLDGDLVWRTGMKEWVPLVQFLTPPSDKAPEPPNTTSTASALDAVVPTNPLAALSCWTGAFSLLICPIGLILGPLAIFFGVMALRMWKGRESEYGAVTSKIRVWIGIATGSLGAIVGAFFVLSVFWK
jgi:hypothetical protein